MQRIILGQNDLIIDHDRARRAPQRELSFYGGIRRGLEKATEGLEEVENIVQQLATSDKDNIRLQRYLSNVEKLYEAVHKATTKASRIKVSTGGEMQ